MANRKQSICLLIFVASVTALWAAEGILNPLEWWVAFAVAMVAATRAGSWQNDRSGQTSQLMPPWVATKRRYLIAVLRGLGFAGPVSGGTHRRGPNRLACYPIYTGPLLAAFGAHRAGVRVWNRCVVAIAAIFRIVKLNAEEALLTRQFPEAHPRYQGRVRAIFPFVY